jgi:hypothetical protein
MKFSDADILEEPQKGGGIRFSEEDILQEGVATPATASPIAPENKSGSQPISRTARFLKGVKDPIDAGAQLLTNALPADIVEAGNKINNWIAENTGMVASVPEGGINQMVSDEEKAYQASRVAGGESGIDAYRLGGNIAALAAGSRYIPVGKTLPARAAIGAATGASYGALQPVTENTDEFWGEKGKQTALGAAVGAIAPVLLSGAARVISPKASVNPQLKALRTEGVKPTVGQALGGKMAAAEEKLQSVPLMGDMISRARGQTLEMFNNAAINRAVAPIGGKVEGAGQEAVRKAGDMLSQYYDDALGQVKHVKFDARFDAEVMQLRGMAQNMVPSMRSKFDHVIKNIVGGRMGPQRSMLGDVYKSVDSEVGKIASKYGKSSVASEQELGDALAQFQNLLKQQMMRSNPSVATKLKAADTGWANLVRIEQAAKSAKNAEGVFTPAQLNAAIQSMDDSVRGRSVSRGTALMQDLGIAGQKVLGSKVPDSGTATRLMLGGGAIGSAVINPAIPAGLAAGGSLYTRPVQNALVRLIADRPQSAVNVAQFVRSLSPYGGLAAPLGNAFTEPTIR